LFVSSIVMLGRSLSGLQEPIREVQETRVVESRCEETICADTRRDVMVTRVSCSHFYPYSVGGGLPLLPYALCTGNSMICFAMPAYNLRLCASIAQGRFAGIKATMLRNFLLFMHVGPPEKISDLREGFDGLSRWVGPDHMASPSASPPDSWLFNLGKSRPSPSQRGTRFLIESCRGRRHSLADVMAAAARWNHCTSLQYHFRLGIIALTERS